MAENAVDENLQRSFERFFEGWLLRQQSFLDQLLTLSLTPDSPIKIQHQKTLIDQILSHYDQYYQEKSRIADADVVILLSPTWFSSYERALLWIGDYKPSLLLRLVDGAVRDLTGNQKQMLDEVKKDTRRQERTVTGTMASVQESLAGPTMLRLARRVGELEQAMEVLRAAMFEVWERADELRLSTARKVVEILTPSQTVQFLAVAAQFQLRVRALGMQMDSSRVCLDGVSRGEWREVEGTKN